MGGGNRYKIVAQIFDRVADTESMIWRVNEAWENGGLSSYLNIGFCLTVNGFSEVALEGQNK